MRRSRRANDRWIPYMTKTVIENPFWHIRMRLCGHGDCRHYSNVGGRWTRELNDCNPWKMWRRAWWSKGPFQKMVIKYSNTRKAAAWILRMYRVMVTSYCSQDYLLGKTNRD